MCRAATSAASLGSAGRMRTRVSFSGISPRRDQPCPWRVHRFPSVEFGSQDRPVVQERDLLRQVIRGEPTDLGRLVVGTQVASDDFGPIEEIQDVVAVLPVAVNGNVEAASWATT